MANPEYDNYCDPPKYKLSDRVIARIVQALQEGLLTGVDVSDVFRQIEVEPSRTENGVLELTTRYQQMVKEHHDKMLADVEGLKREVVKN